MRGDGKRTPQGLQLLEARTLSTGCTILRYQTGGVPGVPVVSGKF
jgi:hypothetical protein